MAEERKWKDKAIKRLNNFVDDISTMEVVTLTGNLTLDNLRLEEEVDDGNGNRKKRKRISFSKVLDSLAGGTSADSSITVVAATIVSLDKDIQQFVKSELSPQDESMMDMHLSAIEMAQEARKATFKMLLSLINKD